MGGAPSSALGRVSPGDAFAWSASIMALAACEAGVDLSVSKAAARASSLLGLDTRSTRGALAARPSQPTSRPLWAGVSDYNELGSCVGYRCGYRYSCDAVVTHGHRGQWVRRRRVRRTRYWRKVELLSSHDSSVWLAIANAYSTAWPLQPSHVRAV